MIIAKIAKIMIMICLNNKIIGLIFIYNKIINMYCLQFFFYNKKNFFLFNIKL